MWSSHLCLKISATLHGFKASWFRIDNDSNPLTILVGEPINLFPTNLHCDDLKYETWTTLFTESRLGNILSTRASIALSNFRRLAVVQWSSTMSPTFTVS